MSGSIPGPAAGSNEGPPPAGRCQTLECGLALALLPVIAAMIALRDDGPASPLRHAYFVPVVVAALRGGIAGGVLAAGGAVLLDAPFVLPPIERTGITTPAVEGLVTFALLLGVGALTGALRDEARRQRRRYETVLTIQRALAEDVPLEVAVGRVRACVARSDPASDVGLVIRDGEGVVIAGGNAMAAESIAARALETGVAQFILDAGEQDRPRRVFVTPLGTSPPAIGVLVIERAGELGAGERRAIATLALHIGLALENARLAARQRRFAEELSDKVASATRQLEEMDRTKSAFVAIASHELRTPLTALQGFSELLTARQFPPEEVRRLAEIMRGETARLVRIVSDFLDLSRLERGLMPVLTLRAVAIESAIVDALDLFRRYRSTHQIVVECAPGLPVVNADPDALDRILKNLISNAIKYSPRDSVVRVTARALTSGMVEVAVEDGGCGIPPEALAHVFEPYYRAPGIGGTARGAGLGLAVVKSLVEAHGGSIAMESAPNQGTRAAFFLPAGS